MKKRLSLLLLLLFVSLVLFSQSNKETEVVIMHVNDMHGKIDKFPYLATLVKEIKKQHPDALLLSAGDIFSGNPIVDRYPEKGYPMIDLMNLLPFNLSTLGNHEFDFGGGTLAKRIKELKHPVVAANIKTAPTYFPKLNSYEVFTIQGIKVAILGLTQVGESGFPDTHPDRVKEFSFEKGINAAMRILPRLKQYPVRIVLSHMGYEQDSILATRNSSITAIVGGHSHTKIQPMKKINGVAIVQAENYVKYLGVLTIKLSGNKVISISDTLLPITKNIIPDSVILKKVEEYNNNEEFKKIAGYASDTIHGIQALGCMMSEAYRRITKTDIALQNSGGIRISQIPRGEITYKQVYELDPFANELIVTKMKPEQIRQIILYGYEKEGSLDIFSSGMKSKIYVDEQKKIRKIELYDMSLQLLDENKTYSVAMGSYLFNAYHFSKLDNGTKTGITTTDALLQFLSQIKGAAFSGCQSSEYIFK